MEVRYDDYFPTMESAQRAAEKQARLGRTCYVAQVLRLVEPAAVVVEVS